MQFGLPRGSLRGKAAYSIRAAHTRARSDRLRARNSSDTHIQGMEVWCLGGSKCIEILESGEPGFKANLFSGCLGKLYNFFKTLFSHLSRRMITVPVSPGCGEVCKTWT